MLHEYLIHQVHKVSRGIGQSKRHDRELKQSITGQEGRLGYVLLANLQLVVSRPQIYLGEHYDSFQLVKQIINPG